MRTIIISAMFSWNDGDPGVKVCRCGLNEANRTSSVYAVYDSPQALKELFDALVTRGSAIMAAETKVTTLIPGQSLIQGEKTSLDEVPDVIEGWGPVAFPHKHARRSPHRHLNL
jgi:hypothetical protein